MFDWAFSTDGFPQRWHCGTGWTEALGWSHIVSDLLIFICYVTIPIALTIVTIRLRPIRGPFPLLLVLFALFILSCGMVHLLEAVIFWEPVYRLSALVKLVTAIVSVATVVALVPTLPKIFRLRTQQDLESEVDAATKMLQERSEELQRSNDELEHFAYIASHDMKAPLRGIQNVARWLREDLPPELLTEDTQENLSLLDQKVETMTSLINGLLSYARVGEGSEATSDVDTKELVAGLLEMIDRGDAVLVTFSSPLPVVHTRPSPLQQVFYNLLQNAVQHHDRDQVNIEVSASENAEGYTFHLEDDGPGIPAQHQEEVFQLFKTLRTNAGNSTGIGLSLVKKMVEQVGGTISLQSEGRGTRFTFTWPKEQAT